MLKGLKDLEDLTRDVESAIQYIIGIDGKTTDGGEFVPDGQMYETEEQANFAAQNPEVERAIQHEIFEFDRRLKK